MAVEIKSETVDHNGQSVTLVSVKEGAGIIGTCMAGHLEHTGNAGNITRVFYIGSDPVIDLVCPGHGSKQSDKLVSFAPGFQGYDQKINGALTNSFNRLNEGESLASGLRDVMSLLEDGVYAVYFADYYPTDGNGQFFWGAYNISHEVRGTAEQNRVIGDKTYKPCFLLPTQPMDYYAARIKVGTDEQVKLRKAQGIVYHVSGLFSALLKGHHGALSCVEKGIPFRCAVIEKICEPYVEKEYETVVTPAEPAAETVETTTETVETAEDGTEVRETETTVQTVVKAKAVNGITGFRSPSVKLPLSAFPKDMLRSIIEGRPEYKPSHFAIMSAKLQTIRRKSINNNALPYVILEKAEQMPDCEMVESAFAIDGITDEQLNCLLRGDVECNGEVIINPNFYSSIITACSYLQFKDTKRFVDFAIAIMENPELSAAHEYAARRVMTLSDNKKVLDFFKNVVYTQESKYEKIIPLAEVFVKRYGN
ncbi:MAG: hypothetical protein K2J77_06870 [Oscillospiraceae bacterium]|nr:hypothetical protein [Oscillospiraceae bacterium]